MDVDEHLRLLGEVIARGHQLELSTAKVLARTLIIDDSAARLLVSNMGQGSAIRVLQELAGRKESGQLEPDRLRAWASMAAQANEARNSVVHGPWVGIPGNGVPAAVVSKRSMKLEPRSHDELRRDLLVISSAVTASIELLEKGART